jgi:hypothetical protein
MFKNKTPNALTPYGLETLNALTPWGPARPVPGSTPTAPGYPLSPCRTIATAMAARSIEMIFEIARRPVAPMRWAKTSL